LCDGDGGWKTSDIRPSSSYTNRIKKQLLQEIGLDWSEAVNYTLDHYYPIVDGGHPSDPLNLVLQLWHEESQGYDIGAKTKDKLEVKVGKLLCEGKMTLQDVPDCFDDWISCYVANIGELPKFDPKKLGGVEEEEIQ
ncbi:MAG: hypothetical protein WC208_15990, partial [Gallionella sp.]